MSTAVLAERSNLIKSYREHEPRAPQAVIEQAQQYVKQGRVMIAAGNAPLESCIIATCVEVITTKIPTQAVTLGADGLPLLLINPHYAIQLAEAGISNLVFVIVHEAGHLIKGHLRDPKAQARNPELWQLATECQLNDWVQRQTAARGVDARGKGARAPMPRIKVIDEAGNATFEEQGVNPEKVYAKYKKDLTDQGKTPVSYDDFVKTDESCYRELCRMAKPPVKMNDKSGCSHQPGNSGKGDNLPMDEEAVDNLVSDALDHVVNSALSGNKAAKEELLALEGRVEGEHAEKMIGRLGLGALRGEAVLPMKASDWKRHVEDKVASLLQEDCRPRVNHRVESVNIVYDLDPQIMFAGDKPLRTGLLICDTSGSMGIDAIKWFGEKCGREEGLVLDIWAIDTQMYPVKMGTPLQGGGGTNFESIVEFCKNMQEPYDFVILITDGHVAPWHPHEPEKWIVLVIPDGNKSLESQMPEVDFHYLTPRDMQISE